ncbi:MAG TPA: aryl-sulfate sulfotransferase [Chitinophagales bacterium]|nr:aryl-sulfate sulfotransferase [Chitinophagales bacterium]
MYFRFVWFLLLLVLFCEIELQAQQYNRPVPPGVARYTYMQNDSSCNGFLLAAPVNVHPTRPGDGSVIESQVLLDCNGYVLWYGDKVPTTLNTDFKYHSAHKLFSYCAVKDSVNYIRYILNSKLHIIDSVINLNGVMPDAHDFDILPDGSYLLTGRLDSIVKPDSSYAIEIPVGRNIKLMGFVLQIISREHKLVWQWNSNEHVNPKDALDDYGYHASLFDYCHGNSVSVANDGNYLISFRNMDAVYKIDRHTGQTIWILGGKSSAFRFVNSRGLSGQHDVAQLPNGNITAYNNGNSIKPHVSEVVEYVIDTLHHTATNTTPYTTKAGLYSAGMGCFKIYKEKKALIGYGQVLYPEPAIELLDSNNKRLFQVFYEDSVMSYRTYLAEDRLSFPRSVIKKIQTKKGLLLRAPVGYKKYMWSTGETTPSISVSKPGTYMVWVNYGNGMLGSLPYKLDALPVK